MNALVLGIRESTLKHMTHVGVQQISFEHGGFTHYLFGVDYLIIRLVRSRIKVKQHTKCQSFWDKNWIQRTRGGF